MHAFTIIVALALTVGGSSKAGQTASATAEKGAPSAEVHLYGNAISGPYSVELVGATVRINGIQAYPALPEFKPPVIELAPTQTAKHVFMAQGWELQRQMERDGKCCGEIATALADMYRSRDDLVAEVWDVRGSSFWVRWKEGGEEEVLIVPSEPAQSGTDRARDEQQLFQSLLGKDCIVVVSSCGRVFVPADDTRRLADVRAEIATARRTPIGEFGTEANRYADSQWQGKYLPSSIARQFARPLSLTVPREEE